MHLLNNLPGQLLWNLDYKRHLCIWIGFVILFLSHPFLFLNICILKAIYNCSKAHLVCFPSYLYLFSFAAFHILFLISNSFVTCRRTRPFLYDIYITINPVLFLFEGFLDTYCYIHGTSTLQWFVDVNEGSHRFKNKRSELNL